MQPRRDALDPTPAAEAVDRRDSPVVKGVAVAGALAIGVTVALNVVYERPLGPALEWTFSDAAIGAQPTEFEVPFLDAGPWTHEEDEAADDGRVLVNGAGSATEGSALALAPRAPSPGARVSTRCRAGAENDACGVAVRVVDARHHYIVRLEPRHAATGGEGEVAASDRAPGGRLVLAVVFAGRERVLDAVDLELGRGWHDLAVDVRGHRLRIEVDGVRRIDRKDRTLPTGGRAGLWSPAGGSAAFDRFGVEPIAARDRS